MPLCKSKIVDNVYKSKKVDGNRKKDILTVVSSETEQYFFCLFVFEFNRACLLFCFRYITSDLDSYPRPLRSENPGGRRRGYDTSTKTETKGDKKNM